ncbi:hypothetical protein pb186bvf_002128 [Paramecium bursaria]
MNYNNKIFVTPLGKEYCDQFDHAYTKRRYSMDIPVKLHRSPSKYQLSNKEINYYIKQRQATKENEQALRSLQLLDQFKKINIISESQYLDRKLHDKFLNLEYTDDQKETHAQKLNQIALKHQKQIEQIQKIQEEVKRRHQQKIDEQFEVVENLPKVEIQSEKSLLLSKQYYQETLQNLQKRKYSKSWQKLPKTLVPK